VKKHKIATIGRDAMPAIHACDSLVERSHCKLWTRAAAKTAGEGRKAFWEEL